MEECDNRGGACTLCRTSFAGACRLIADAALAEELFDPDELERHAEEQRNKKETDR